MVEKGRSLLGKVSVIAGSANSAVESSSVIKIRGRVIAFYKNAVNNIKALRVLDKASEEKLLPSSGFARAAQGDEVPLETAKHRLSTPLSHLRQKLGKYGLIIASKKMPKEDRESGDRVGYYLIDKGDPINDDGFSRNKIIEIFQKNKNSNYPLSGIFLALGMQADGLAIKEMREVAAKKLGRKIKRYKKFTKEEAVEIATAYCSKKYSEGKPIRNKFSSGEDYFRIIEVAVQSEKKAVERKLNPHKRKKKKSFHKDKEIRVGLIAEKLTVFRALRSRVDKQNALFSQDNTKEREKPALKKIPAQADIFNPAKSENPVVSIPTQPIHIYEIENPKLKEIKPAMAEVAREPLVEKEVLDLKLFTESEIYVIAQRLLDLEWRNEELLTNFNIDTRLLNADEIKRLFGRVRAEIKKSKANAVNFDRDNIESARKKLDVFMKDPEKYLNSGEKVERVLLDCFDLEKIKDGSWEELFPNE